MQLCKSSAGRKSFVSLGARYPAVFVASQSFSQCFKGHEQSLVGSYFYTSSTYPLPGNQDRKINFPSMGRSIGRYILFSHFLFHFFFSGAFLIALVFFLNLPVLHRTLNKNVQRQRHTLGICVLRRQHSCLVCR